MRPPLAALAAAAALSGCAVVEVGREFNLPAFDARVQRGATTQADVRDWLGEPTGIGQAVESSGERYEQWTYYHGEGRLPRIGDGHFSLLQIKFDGRGVVYAYNWSAEAR